MNSKVRACQVCGSNESSMVHRNNMASLDGLDMSYVLVRCNVCGFHFARELPEEAQYFRYYEELSKYDSQPIVSTVDRLRINAAVDFCVSLGIPKDALILDLGCGFGALLASLRNAGWERLQGLDPAPKSALRAREQFDLECIHQGTLFQASEVIDLGRADLVCLMAVLEHLPELRRDVSRLLSHLREGCRLLIEVPALDLFIGSAGEPFGELSLEHIQFFSSQSLRNFFASLGCRVLGEELVPLPALHSGALFVLVEYIGAGPMVLTNELPVTMDDYLNGSHQRWVQVLRKIPEVPYVLYGAGSHSARLLPQLNSRQKKNLVAVLDGNKNLHGKRFDQWVVHAPEELAKFPGLPVLISSYRSEKLIAQTLKKYFPDHELHLMYGDV